LISKYRGRKNWRELPYEDVRRFLLHLFGESSLKSKTGIFVEKGDDGKLVVTFKGRVNFHYFLVNGKPSNKEFEVAADRMNARLLREFQARSDAIDQKYQVEMAKLNAGEPLSAYLSAR
jgi:hypothetical protein